MFADGVGLILLAIGSGLWLAGWLSYYWILYVGLDEINSYVEQGWNVVHHPNDDSWHVTFQGIWLTTTNTQQAGWKYVRRCA